VLLANFSKEAGLNELTDQESVRAHYGEPSHMSKAKELDHLDQHCRAFIALSPFIVIATSGADGRADASPRGDVLGFVAILDERRLLIPDRTGNKRVDTIMNITANPHVGILFMVPGINESLRVNGRASITVDAALLAPLTVQGKAPNSGILVITEEVFFHCAKPLIRSQIWNPERRVARESFPSLGRILADQIAGGKTEEYERGIEEQYRTRLY
jgi:uncharacterized protein